jgi:2-succinyl-5-enolpyruvyl-6-hydroxy-3-cyclohexene-1-carboxylate synthase
VTLDLQSEWASRLLGALAESGLRDVVVSPGSRSTPFVLAAARDGRLRLHDVIDERAAAFFALGQARASGRPSLLLCTSGTAGAHYLPAVIEAALTWTPLLVLTADRPVELQGCAAPQTVDQVKLFGAHARAYFELGAAEPATLAAVRRMAAQAVATALHPLPGPVHLNARARKPLEPREGPLLPPPPAVTRVFAPRALPSSEAVAALVDACRGARRGLVVCGPAPLGPRREIAALAARAGFPLLAEAASQLRFADVVSCDGFAALLRVEWFRRDFAPDLVLQFGAPPTASAFAGFASGAARFVVAPHGWNDPESSATAMVQADAIETARAVAAALAPTHPGDWAERWRAANALAWRALDAVVDAGPLNEAQVARETVRSVPRGGLLMLGNSLPLRTVDQYCRSALAECGVLSQRGANGIDGLVAGAAGAASTGRPVTLLVGDVSLLHDLGGLALAARAPLTVVAVHNGGGRIFEQLPALPAEALAHFTTPHGLGFAHAAALFGLRYARVESRGELARALAAGGALVEAVVPPHGAAELQGAAVRQIAAALRELP